jgi:hypothetical protein
MSYPYVDRSIEPPLLVIESGDRVMPGISTLLDKRQIRPPYALRSPVVWMSVFPPKSLQCCRIVAPFRYGPILSFRPFLMHRWFHDSGCSLSSMFASVKAPNHTYYIMHSAGKQPGHESAFGSICVPLWHEISARLSWFHCSSRSLECY